MIETAPSVRPSVIHRVFYNHSELRAGWRLVVFLALVYALGYAANAALRRLLHGSDDATSFLAFEAMDFLIVLFTSWLMGRFEGRTIGDYGLPWHKIFGIQFWQGAALGFAALTGLLLTMRTFGVFHFEGIALHGFDIWKWAIAYALVFALVAVREEFGNRGYELFTLSAGIGFWPAAILLSAYFGYHHGGNSGEDWIGLFNAGAFGLLLCSCYVAPATSGCQSVFTSPSTGARLTSTACPTVVKRCPVIF